jgi:hypothetical protein
MPPAVWYMLPSPACVGALLHRWTNCPSLSLPDTLLLLLPSWFYCCCLASSETRKQHQTQPCCSTSGAVGAPPPTTNRNPATHPAVPHTACTLLPVPAPLAPLLTTFDLADRTSELARHCAAAQLVLLLLLLPSFIVGYAGSSETSHAAAVVFGATKARQTTRRSTPAQNIQHVGLSLPPAPFPQTFPSSQHQH